MAVLLTNLNFAGMMCKNTFRPPILVLVTFGLYTRCFSLIYPGLLVLLISVVVSFRSLVVVAHRNRLFCNFYSL
ncbi:hypothetical protein CW304_29600 [Bacillus sp. UFRGS-B20]|nr:hypothetical protein CW304_29600 [Bacillus sp. UFRGS-B20]